MSNDTIPFDIETVCTHLQLSREVGGTESLLNLLAAGESSDSTSTREDALLDVTDTLRRRTPPIFPGDLSDRTELRRAVMYGSLEKLYRMAMSGSGSVYADLHKIFQKKYDAEMLGLAPTLQNGSRGSAFSIQVSRR